MILYYKTPDMSTGKSTQGEFHSPKEVEEFLKAAVDTMPENTLFYYRDRMEGRAWVLRSGKMIEVWNPHIHRKYKFTLADIMRVTPNIPTEDLLTQ